MIPQNSNWDQRIEVMKGDYGEAICDQYLESKGFVIYQPITKSAHWFDRVAIKNKEKLIIAECKTKARRNKYPDTGFNLSHYKQYKRIENVYKLNVFIFFIDEMLGTVYGNFLKKIDVELCLIENKKQYPSIEKNIIYFPLCLMEHIQDLNENQIEELKNLSRRNYDYSIYKSGVV